MTIIDAINAAIESLEGVRLPVRDGENATRVVRALALLDALKATVDQNTKTQDPDEKGDEET